MKVYVYPSDNWGCGAYRLTWPAQAAAEVDHSLDITVTRPEARTERPRFDPRTLEVLSEDFPADADVIVFQRPHHFWHARLIEVLRARGVAVVVDMDDDLGRIDAHNSAFKVSAPKIEHPEAHKLPPVERSQLPLVPNANSWHNAADSCRAATLVTVTTPRLAEVYGKHGRVRVLPNMVPASYLHVPHYDSDLIGWAGSMHSHPHDPQQLGGALANLVGRGARFETVGNPTGVRAALALPAEPISTGDVALHQWPLEMARFGIGIAPLADTRFNEAKSWLKPLEYNAVGVPCVVSPRADYQRWANVSGGCVTADRPRKWEATLRALINDPARRQEMSEAGRAAAADHTLEGNAWRWVEAWHDAAELQRSTRAAAGAA